MHNSFSEIINSKIISLIINRWNLENWLKLNTLKRIKSESSVESLDEKINLYNSKKQEIQSINRTLETYKISHELGGVTCKSLFDFFNSDNGQLILNKLKALNINPKSNNYNPNPKTDTYNSSPIIDTQWVITGTLSKSRDVFKSYIENLGGKVMSSISKKTDYLLAGENAGSKLSKATNLNVTILDEKDFLSLIKKTTEAG